MATIFTLKFTLKSLIRYTHHLLTEIGAAMTALTATAAEARTNFSRIASAVSATGERVTVFKNSKPWVVIAPSDEADADYLELVRSGILEGREQIAAGLGIEGTDALRAAVAEIRAQHD